MVIITNLVKLKNPVTTNVSIRNSMCILLICLSSFVLTFITLQNQEIITEVTELRGESKSVKAIITGIRVFDVFSESDKPFVFLEFEDLKAPPSEILKIYYNRAGGFFTFPSEDSTIEYTAYGGSPRITTRMDFSVTGFSGSIRSNGRSASGTLNFSSDVTRVYCDLSPKLKFVQFNDSSKDFIDHINFNTFQGNLLMANTRFSYIRDPIRAFDPQDFDTLVSSMDMKYGRFMKDQLTLKELRTHQSIFESASQSISFTLAVYTILITMNSLIFPSSIDPLVMSGSSAADLHQEPLRKV